MSFEDATAHLEALGVDAMKSLKPSLTRIAAVLETLNDPQQAIPSIHITGTNGKTSVARIASALLESAGLSVGTFTSPHLESVTERIAFNGTPLDEAVFGGVFAHLRPYLEVTENDLGEKLSYFEVLVAMFFLWASESVDVAVVEVGLGGRWDATNLLRSPVNVITSIGLDHMAMLGPDRATIAREKAGIIKPDAVVVTGERDPSIIRIISDVAGEQGAQMSVIDRDFGLEENRVALGGRYVSLRSSSGDFEEHYLALHGAHQGVNAAVALEAVSRFIPGQPLGHDVVAEAFNKVVVPGRLEIARTTSETSAAIVLDVAHNPEGMSALVGALHEAFAFETVTVVLGVLDDKDLTGMLAELTRLNCRLLVTQPRSPRATPTEDLRSLAEDAGFECETETDPIVAIERASVITDPSDLICVTGSHYLVGEARASIFARRG